MGHEAIELYQRIPSSLHDETLNICVLNACSHSGLIDEAERIYRRIEKKNEKIVTVMVRFFSRLSVKRKNKIFAFFRSIVSLECRFLIKQQNSLMNSNKLIRLTSSCTVSER